MMPLAQIMRKNEKEGKGGGKGYEEIFSGEG